MNNIINTLLSHILSTTLTGVNDSDKHLMTLFSIALETKSTKILELGVRDGHTTIPFVLASVLNKGKTTSVDINPTTLQIPSEVASHHEFVLSDSITFLENCVRENRKYDLIFIDDWHTYEHVKKELSIISKLMDFNTVVLMHDLMAGHDPYYWLPSSDHHINSEWEGGGPFKAVYELDINEFEWATIPTNNGLTLLRKRSPYVIT